MNEEESINYEFGVRYSAETFYADAIGFVTDFDNLLGICTPSSGSNCEIGDAFNGNAATIAGIEFRSGLDLAGIGLPGIGKAVSRSFQIPLDLSYTYTNSQFDTDIADTEYWGDVARGDPVPYIPEHQFLLRLGLMVSHFSADLSVNYIDGVCTRPSCGEFDSTDDSITLDLGAAYAFTDYLDLFARIENLTNEHDIMGRQPYGARPNKSRTAALGVRLAF